MPIASAVATLEPQIAANSVQATTVTRPSEPGRPPSQAAARLTSASAMPPKRMKVAAITNSGSAIKVGEFNSLMTSCAAPTSGWPDEHEHDAGAKPEHQEDRHARGQEADEQRDEACHRAALS